MKKNYCYFGGKVTTLDKASISPYDIGLLRGYGVFDVMCTQNGKPFLLEEHWERFQNSAKELNLRIPVNKKKFRDIVEKLIKKNGYEKSTIRTVLTGGVSSNGFNHEGKETFFILIEKFDTLPKNVFEKGAGIVTLEYNRDLPHAKITNYIRAIKMQKEKLKNKAIEIVYVKGNNVLEASTSNIFVVKNGEIVTTKQEILHGITRNLTLRLARGAGFKVKERKIKKTELFSADEVFLTASNKDVVPVVKVDGDKIGNGKPGKITKKIIQEFEQFVRKY